MQTVDLNLATRPFKNDTLLWVSLFVAAGLLGSLSWWNVTTWREHRRLLDDLRESQVSIGERFTALDRRDLEALRRVDAVDLPVLVARADKANEVIRWKSFSWTRLFNLLQEIQPWDVQMTSIRPVFRGDRRAARNELEDLEQVPVSVEGTAKTLKDFLAFERALIFDPHFDRVEPDNTATDDNSGETIFRVRFLYDPRVGDEAEVPADQIAEGEGEAATTDGAAGELVEQPPGDDADASVAAVGAPDPGESGELASENLKKIRRGGGKQRSGGEIPASTLNASQEPAPTDPSPATAAPPLAGASDAAPGVTPRSSARDAVQDAGAPQLVEEIGTEAGGPDPSVEPPPPGVGDSKPDRSDLSPAGTSSQGRERSADDADEDGEER